MHGPCPQARIKNLSWNKKVFGGKVKCPEWERVYSTSHHVARQEAVRIEGTDVEVGLTDGSPYPSRWRDWILSWRHPKEWHNIFLLQQGSAQNFCIGPNRKYWESSGLSDHYSTFTLWLERNHRAAVLQSHFIYRKEVVVTLGPWVIVSSTSDLQHDGQWVRSLLI